MGIWIICTQVKLARDPGSEKNMPYNQRPRRSCSSGSDYSTEVCLIAIDIHIYTSYHLPETDRDHMGEKDASQPLPFNPRILHSLFRCP